MNRRGWATTAVLLLAFACGATLLAGCGQSASPVRPAHGTHSGAAEASLAALPDPAKSFAIPRPRLLGNRSGVTRWAPVLDPVEARERPSRSSPGVVHVGTRTPEGTTNLVVVIGEAVRAGVTWVHARLAVLPDSRTGWLPRSALGGWQFVTTHLVINRARQTLTLYRAGRVVYRTRVGVGKPSTPTPAGRFYIRDRLTRYASPEYGPLAFGTSARSAYETDWPAGGFIGIHGTDEPGLIPGRISHGCLRLRNAAILALGHLLPIGTPVTII
jgi:hypothetical protein